MDQSRIFSSQNARLFSQNIEKTNEHIFFNLADDATPEYFRTGNDTLL